MVENVARKVIFVTLALIVSLAFLLIPEQAFRLGLDLQGGTRLLYRLDVDKAQVVHAPTVGRNRGGTNTDDLSSVVQIIRNRVDPTGVLDASIRQEGSDRIVIELPGTPELQAKTASSTLAEPLTELNRVSLVL